MSPEPLLKAILLTSSPTVMQFGGSNSLSSGISHNIIETLNLQDYISQVLIPTEKIYQIRKMDCVYICFSANPLNSLIGLLGWMQYKITWR